MYVINSDKIHVDKTNFFCVGHGEQKMNYHMHHLHHRLPHSAEFSYLGVFFRIFASFEIGGIWTDDLESGSHRWQTVLSSTNNRRFLTPCTRGIRTLSKHVSSLRRFFAKVVAIYIFTCMFTISKHVHSRGCLKQLYEEPLVCRQIARTSSIQ